MLEILISLLITLLILGVIWWAGRTILGIVPAPAPIMMVWDVVMVVVLLVVLLKFLLPLAGMHGAL